VKSRTTRSTRVARPLGKTTPVRRPASRRTGRGATASRKPASATKTRSRARKPVRNKDSKDLQTAVQQANQFLAQQATQQKQEGYLNQLLQNADKDSKDKITQALNELKQKSLIDFITLPWVDPGPYKGSDGKNDSQGSGLSWFEYDGNPRIVYVEDVTTQNAVKDAMKDYPDALKMLAAQEEIRDTPYLDLGNKGKLTVGIGFNLEDRKDARAMIEALPGNPDFYRVVAGLDRLNATQIKTLFDNTVKEAQGYAKNLIPNYAIMPTDKQGVVVNMIFNEGYGAFNNAAHKPLRDALNAGDYQKAANEMEKLPWYNKVGNRAKQLVDIMRQ
jgi:GH24 family phage-related lysozyme (muramidase)